MDTDRNGEDTGFGIAMIPVRFLRSGADSLASRSSARRLLAPLRRFQSVVLDFRHVDAIGRPFADEIFRVFADANPHIDISAINAGPAVQKAIGDVRSGLARDTALWAFLEQDRPSGGRPRGSGCRGEG
ncbi:STAS-like domain-containing protein [Cupriavidus sp. AU9028]|uniref:STAS-like domain-containing protein n=1 Tax=Cupriavidus sp. AU9028 TaxID=2871157 RepID=UPI002103C46C|nr:STAS-like domain-containing protein [Cupriavidus sp. AU9028]